MKKLWMLLAFIIGSVFIDVAVLNVWSSKMGYIVEEKYDNFVEAAETVESTVEVDDYDWHFVYKGTKFMLPMKVSDFVVTGSQSDLFDEMLQPETSTTAYVTTSDGIKWDLNIVNRGNYEQAAKDCDIIAFGAIFNESPVDVDLIGPDGSPLGSDYSVHDESKFPAPITSKALGGNGPLVCIKYTDRLIVGELTYLYEDGVLIGIRMKHEGN